MSASVSFSTRITDLLGIDCPIVLAGMGRGATTPDLVAAVSNAGGFGILGVSGAPVDLLLEHIARIRSLTDQPFGVNWVVSPCAGATRDTRRLLEITNRYRADIGLDPMDAIPEEPDLDISAKVEAALAAGVPLLSFGLGDPAPHVDAAHAAGARVMTMVATVDEAVAAADAGSDIIVAQGYEAGGHRSNFDYVSMDETPAIGTLALVPQVVDAVDVPVLAAGGIMDGRGLMAAIALGADGVLMGTRFLTATESGIFPAYRQAVIAATETSAWLCDAPTGRPARSIRNRLTGDLGQASLPFPWQSSVLDDIYAWAWESNDPDLFPLWAGQGAGLAKREQPAAEIIDEIIREAVGIRERLGAGAAARA
jgi:nitronate monooxygenase